MSVFYEVIIPQESDIIDPEDYGDKSKIFSRKDLAVKYAREQAKWLDDKGNPRTTDTIHVSPPGSQYYENVFIHVYRITLDRTRRGIWDALRYTPGTVYPGAELFTSFIIAWRGDLYCSECGEGKKRFTEREYRKLPTVSFEGLWTKLHGNDRNYICDMCEGENSEH